MKSETEYYSELLFSAPGVVARCVVPERGVPADMATPFMKSIGGIIPDQTHTSNVAIAETPDQFFPQTDALITFSRNLPIGIRTADCVPILLYSPDIQAISAIHAGWRGTLSGIVDNTLSKLKELGANATETIAIFGPSISSAAYEVSPELAAKFALSGFADCITYPSHESEASPNVPPSESRPHIDLQQVNTIKLLNHGVKPYNIIPHSGCTFSSVDSNSGSHIYHSYRRNSSSPARNLSFITLLPDIKSI